MKQVRAALGVETSTKLLSKLDRYFLEYVDIDREALALSAAADSRAEVAALPSSLKQSA